MFGTSSSSQTFIMAYIFLCDCNRTQFSADLFLGEDSISSSGTVGAEEGEFWVETENLPPRRSRY